VRVPLEAVTPGNFRTLRTIATMLRELAVGEGVK